jgi:hypothetical protein
MANQYAITTFDNPYHPIEQFMNMSAAFYTRRRQCFTVAAEKFDTCGGGI